MDDNNQIIIYQSEDGETRIEVKFTDETVWLSQQQLCELYNTSKSNVSEHIKHIFEDGELDEESVVRNFRTTAADGKSYNVTFYNLDMIISLGYRIRSVIATHFRRWATERLKEYIIKGFTMDDERLKGNGGGVFFHPYTKVEFLEKELMVSRPTATRYLNSLVEIGLLDKITVGRTHYYMNMPLMDLFLSVSDSQIKEDVQPIESMLDHIPVASQKG